MLVALAATYSLAGPYFREAVSGEWGGVSFALLAVGAAQGALTRYKVYEREKITRDEFESAPYIVALIVVWPASLIAGNVLHELSRRP